MAIGTIDIVYTVLLSDGTLAEMTSGQYRRYQITMKILMTLLLPVRKIYQWWIHKKGGNHGMGCDEN